MGWAKGQQQGKEPGKTAAPVRTCIGCRAKGSPGTLVRVALGHDGRLLIDRNAPGRGAWLCRLEVSGLARPECIAEAAKRRAFSRAFHHDVGRAEVEVLLAMACEHARIGQPAVVPPVGTAALGMGHG